MKVAILFDPGGKHWDQKDIVAAVEGTKVVQNHLRRAGHEATIVPIRPNDWRYIAKIRQVDVVFNLCEGLDGHSKYEDWIVATLELAGTPYTGCRPWATSVCHRKHVANTVLAAAGIPVPRFALAHHNKVPTELELPVIVKPAAEDASLGIDSGAICTSRKSLKRRIALMAEQWESVLVQEYVAGREFNVGFIGKTMLPISEITFDNMPEGSWPILTYASKWDEGSPEDLGSIPQCPAQIPAELAKKLEKIGRDAWELMAESEGYGRVDVRVDSSGQPYVLEVNPNPDLSENAGLARMARADGWDYGELLQQVLRETLERAAARKAGQELAGVTA
jgi:D-alanine-D-alanine ligase